MTGRMTANTQDSAARDALKGCVSEGPRMYVCMYVCMGGRGRENIQSSPYFDPTHTRTGWIGQPPILNRHEVVTIDGDVDTLGQATP